MVSGGVGVAPMMLAARQARAEGLEICWFHGARSQALSCSEWLGERVVWATDDGSAGFAGSVVEAWRDLVEEEGEFDATLACGPNAMLRAVAERDPQAQVSVETYMGCGTGVCLVCAVAHRDGGWDRACSEGPVYRAGNIDWEKLVSPRPYSRLP